ncbi:carbohydrate kinase family protein [bacterium]|nr:MAG: carbohydrate kinase family protein [bacterium]
MKKYDLICIGDTTVDAFIKLHDASLQCDKDHEHCKLCMPFADKVPYESLTVVPAVGNSSNVAVGAARLGLKSACLNAVGADYFGRQILDVYKKEKVGAELVKLNPGLPTNYHFVLNFHAERTILIKHQKYSYYSPSKIGTVPWIYFSSIAEHTLPFHHELARYLKAHKEIKMGFNPGTFQLLLGAKKLKDVYRNTYALFVNRQEAQKILKVNNPEIGQLFKGLHKLGPKIVAITDGPKGAYASDGRSQYFMPIYPDPKPPLERTGAGDSFAAGFMAALVRNLPMTEALKWGPVNAMSVVQEIGAQKGLLTKSQLLNYLRKAPKSYQPRKI